MRWDRHTLGMMQDITVTNCTQPPERPNWGINMRNNKKELSDSLTMRYLMS
jgi:hypothetical protein